MDERRRFGVGERIAAYIVAVGHCESCGVALERGWHADHEIPWSKGGATDATNVSALCPKCNQKKGDRSMGQVRLRKWQNEALKTYKDHEAPDFLLVATPGSGKTRFAIEVARNQLREQASRVVVVVPTDTLRDQWHATLTADGFRAYKDFENVHTEPPREANALVVTYQQVGMAHHVHTLLATRVRTFAVFDEIHHCGENKSWGVGLSSAFAPAIGRLALSGTPFRSDNSAIPFVRYVDGKSAADFTYGYRDALRDSVVRVVHFRHQSGNVEFLDHSGAEQSHRLHDDVPEDLVRQRLRAALSVSGDFVPGMLDVAEQELNKLRECDPNAAGLVIAKDQEHATRIHKLIPGSVLAISAEGPDASKRIQRFKTSNERWLVSVKMVSEGVDVPRLRVLVYASNVADSELFFRQAVGRIVRRENPGEYEDSVVFLPEDARLRAFAADIEEERDHVLEEIEAQPARAESDDTTTDPSLWAPISSTHEEYGATSGGQKFSQLEFDAARKLCDETEGLDRASVIGVANLLRHLQHIPSPLETDSPAPSMWNKEFDHLRSANQTAIRLIATKHELEFSDVQIQLNDAVGIKSTRNATTPQLRKRLELAQRWLTRGKSTRD